MRRLVLMGALAVAALAFGPAGPARGVDIDGTVAIAAFTFSPTVAGPQSTTVGAQVTFRNFDPVAHTASFPPGCGGVNPCTWNTGTIPPLSSQGVPGQVTITLPAWLIPGPYVYYCQNHSGLTSNPPIPMRGVLVLTP
jgi:plastocyanin